MIRSRMTTSPVDQPRTDAREGPPRPGWERWAAAWTRRLQWAVGSPHDDLFTGHKYYYEWCGSTWTQSSSTFFFYYYLEKEISVLAFCSRLPSRTVRSWSRAAGLVRRWITASSSLWRSRAAILGASKSSRFTISPGQNLMICLNPSGLCASG